MPLLTPGIADPRVAELCRLLEKAEAAVRAQPAERVMDGFDRNAAFAEFLQSARVQILSDSVSWSGRRKLYSAFAPTSDWDDCVGDADLGNRIFELLSSLYGTWR